MAHDFDCNKPFESYSASNFDLQYIRPPVVQELLHPIVSVDLPRIKEEIDSCIAASFRSDASIEKLDVTFPLLKSICAVHSTPNAYKDLCKIVPEIEHLVKKLSGIATFFHAVAKRTSDLEKVGEKENLTVHRIPKYFEVRWSKFTAALLDAVLCSWQALVKFSEEQHGTEIKIISL